MHSQWESLQGLDRPDNRDAAALFQQDGATLAVIVDGSSQGAEGQAFAHAWLQTLLETLRHRPTALTPEGVIETMQHVQRHLRGQYLTASAAMAGVLILDQARTAWGFTCGDCRIGQKQRNAEIIWLTHPHTVATAWDGAVQPLPMGLADPDRLTRCLKTRRFTTPDIWVLDHAREIHWVLATDGYWRQDRADDSSALHLYETLSFSSVVTDTPNWFTHP
jgi:serine/threonine protein phosphatase PrpC